MVPSLECIHKKPNGIVVKCEELSIVYVMTGMGFAFVEIEKDPKLSHLARGCGEDQVVSAGGFATLLSHLRHLLAELLFSLRYRCRLSTRRVGNFLMNLQGEPRECRHGQMFRADHVRSIQDNFHCITEGG